MAIIRREGRDVTLVATSYMVVESMKASEELEREGVNVEVIDLRSVKPLDENLLFESIKKTGKLIIADGGWKTCGVAAEIASRVLENVFDFLKAPIKRITLPDLPAPASRVLEEVYYPKEREIVQNIKELMGRNYL